MGQVNGFGEGGLDAIGSGTHSIDGDVVFRALKNMIIPVRDAIGVSLLRPTKPAT